MVSPAISTDLLKRAQVPPPGASWDAIQAFALTFDGYAAFGNKLGELAQRHRAAGTVPTDLEELRGCLFYEQRAWRHAMSVPDRAGLAHIERLLEGIRRALAQLPVRF